MSICWYCHWGWPQAVADVLKAAVDKVETAHHGMYDGIFKYGPAHIVWEDENFDTDSIDHCIENCDQRRYCDDFSDAEVALVRESLVNLKAIPEEVRCCQPKDYDGEHPEKFPPPANIPWSKS